MYTFIFRKKQIFSLSVITLATLVFSYLYYAHPYYNESTIVIPEVQLKENTKIYYDIGFNQIIANYLYEQDKLAGYYQKKYSIEIPKNINLNKLKLIFNKNNQGLIYYFNKNEWSNNITLDLLENKHLFYLNDLHSLNKISIFSNNYGY